MGKTAINRLLSPSTSKIHNPERGGYPLARATRVLLALWGLLLLCGFATAFVLEPDPRGYGTHEALGLPPCTFRELFGIPCPGCGMTTSVSSFVHGRLVESARANVGGFLLAAIGLVQIPWAASSVWRGRLVGVGRPDAALAWVLRLVCTATLLQWLPRVF